MIIIVNKNYVMLFLDVLSNLTVSNYIAIIVAFVTTISAIVGFYQLKTSKIRNKLLKLKIKENKEITLLKNDISKLENQLSIENSKIKILDSIGGTNDDRLLSICKGIFEVFVLEHKFIAYIYNSSMTSKPSEDLKGIFRSYEKVNHKNCKKLIENLDKIVNYVRNIEFLNNDNLRSNYEKLVYLKEDICQSVEIQVRALSTMSNSELFLENENFKETITNFEEFLRLKKSIDDEVKKMFKELGKD